MRKSISAHEQEQAVALLKSPAGSFPGAAPARLHGRYASLSIDAIASLFCFHWEFEYMQEFADATAHGDFWRVRIPVTQDWQARVQGYMPRAAASYLAAIGSLTTDPAVMTLTLYNDAGTHAIFTGTCWAQRGRVVAPMAMVTQEIELVSAQVPTVLA